MNQKKIEFIQIYIKKLEDALDDLHNELIDENIVFDIIQEIRGVFIREIPEIDEAIWLRSGMAERDAKILIGILKLQISDMPNESVYSDEVQTFNDNYVLLKLEYKGIKDTICEYTDSRNILNYLEKLGDAIEQKNLKLIKYCLLHIEEWYKTNITQIHTNEFCYNKNDHDENKKKVETFCKVFEELPDLISLDDKNEISKDQPIIFISHKSVDKKYGDALQKFIVGLGVKDDQLIYTSHPLHKIPLDMNIYDYLRKHIYNKMFMIILWSDEYLNSPACLNEMGAAWVTQSDYTNIYVPTFSFGNPKYHECAVDTRKMGAVLNGDGHCKANMIELKNKIQELFDLKHDEQKSMYLLDQFIQEIVNIKKSDEI